jgi:hypothetical protein
MVASLLPKGAEKILQMDSSQSLATHYNTHRTFQTYPGYYLYKVQTAHFLQLQTGNLAEVIFRLGNDSNGTSRTWQGNRSTSYGGTAKLQ